MASRIGQDLTVVKSEYYHILRKNIENQSRGLPYNGKDKEKENCQSCAIDSRGETLKPGSKNILVSRKACSLEGQKSFIRTNLSSDEKIIHDNFHFIILFLFPSFYSFI
jgi:hypothetical protein